MNKIKTRHAAKKRFRKTPNDKFVRKKACRSHLLEKKTPKQKRRLSLSAIVFSGEAKSIQKMLPNT
jgi:large subunit ribosomal protein L35